MKPKERNMWYSIYSLFSSALLILVFVFQLVQCKPAKTEAASVETVEESPEYPWPLLSTYVDGLEKSYIMGKFDPAVTEGFSVVPEQYADRNDRILHDSTLAAFIKMYNAAKNEGIDLQIISATRNFDVQKSIWEAKWNGERLLEAKIDARTIKDPKERALEILKWSSMPGSSRHHWGTDIDINALNNEYFESDRGLKEYTWLEENAWNFGFGQPYTAKDSIRPTGYNMEKWHWSYLPLSIPLVRRAEKELHDSDITGFDGSETATSIQIVENYVLGINPKLR